MNIFDEKTDVFIVSIISFIETFLKNLCILKFYFDEQYPVFFLFEKHKLKFRFFKVSLFLSIFI